MGLEVPANELVETDGGRINTEPSRAKYLTYGTVMGMSSLAAKKLEELGSPLSIGDVVYLHNSVLSSSSYHFYMDRTKQIQNFEGVISVPHALITAKVNKK